MVAHTKKRRDCEVYEDYWKFTAAFTDLHGEDFNSCLRVIIRFIDLHKTELSEDNRQNFSILYKQLQDQLISLMNYEGKSSDTTVRKIINQCVKMGFIEPYLRGYDKRVLVFLKNTANVEMQNQIFSEIFYEKSTLMSSTTVDKRQDSGQIQFLLNTLANLPEGKHLNYQDLTALMLVNIKDPKYTNKNYITLDELENRKRFADAINFADRKYNQIKHLFSILFYFNDVVCDVKKGTIQLNRDNQVIVRDRISTVRDPYRFNLFKGSLCIESEEVFENKVCFLTGKPNKGLVASHIVPSAECIRSGHVDDAYNPNNGLLLSPNVDAYFDKNDITFDSDGYLIVSKTLSDLEIDQLRGYSLNQKLLNQERLQFLDKHRQKFYQKNGDGIKVC